METKGFEPYKTAYYAVLVGVISKVILTATFGLNQTNYVHPTFTSCICFHFSRTPGKHLTVSKPIPQHLLFCLCLLYYNSFWFYPVKIFIIFKKGVLIFHRVRITIRQFCSQGLFLTLSSYGGGHLILANVQFVRKALSTSAVKISSERY